MDHFDFVAARRWVAHLFPRRRETRDTNVLGYFASAGAPGLERVVFGACFFRQVKRETFNRFAERREERYLGDLAR
jgi:hypothetical protein